MKSSLLVILGLALLSFSSCKKTSIADEQTDRVGLPTDLNQPPYGITIRSISFQNNQTTVTWEITNLRPETTPDLKHWSLVFSDETIGDNIVAAYHGTSVNNLVPTPINYSPVAGSCYSGNALSFNFGTNGSTPSLYVVVLKGAYSKGLCYGVTQSTAKDDCMLSKISGVLALK
jgi:hypothetical protein